MDLIEVTKVLNQMLNQEPAEGRKRNIVFWYDEEGEFAGDIQEFCLEKAAIIVVSDNNSFALKYRLEVEDPETNFLLYCPQPKPLPRENWLLDILKYSKEFSTDKTTVIMRNLGVKDTGLRSVFKKYAKFFDNKERYKKFASYNLQDYTEQKVDVAVLSALCRLPLPDLEAVVKAVLTETVHEKNACMEAIDKFGDPEAFWGLVHRVYGCNFPEKSLEKLVLVLMVTHMSYNLEAKLPAAWGKFLSPKKSDVIVFMNHFMNHTLDRKAFDELSAVAAKQLNLREYISKWDTETFLKCDTFQAFDDEIIARLKSSLLQSIGEFEKYRKIINARRTSHWFEHLRAEYSCLFYAMEMFRMEKELNKTIKGSSTYGILELYAREYYLLDTFYRKFYEAFDRLEAPETFTPLAEMVENTYTHWFLNELSIKWSGAVEDELREDWSISGVTQQRDFFRHFILPHLDKGERVFVLISDALRYEAAKEFCHLLNTERKGAADIQVMQSSLPSYTKLGMASLLPHRNIEITGKGDVMIDGINTQSTDNRQKILQKYCLDSVAVLYTDIKDMKRQEYKETFEGKKLIYIFHNTIDARGDNAETEREVFDAAEKAFTDLRGLIKSLINHLSATNIYITADHGFIYRRTPLAESDKTPKEMVDSFYDNRRFILTDSDKTIEGTTPISMKYLLGGESKIKALIPKGVNCFKVQGRGSNYVHGGASLQEIVVPVLKFKNDRSKSDKLEVKKVDVKLTNISRKITNSITYLEFFQTEKVADKQIPRRLKLFFADEAGNRISNENIIIADSRSCKPEDRTYREKFTLKDMPYDKAKEYYLILEDEEETVEKVYEKIPFVIDLAFVNDFGF